MRVSVAAIARFAVVATTAAVVNALHADEVGLKEWQVEQIGYPLSVIPAAFNSTAEFLVVKTDRDVVAALSPATGETVWRHVPAPGEKVIQTIVKRNRVYVTSTDYLGNAWLRVRSLADGKHEVEQSISAPSSLSAGEIVRPAVDVLANGDAILAFHNQVVAVKAGNGEPKWIASDSDINLNVTAHAVRVHGEQAYILGWNQAGAAIRVVDAASGAVKADLSQDYTEETRPRLAVASKNAPLLAWLTLDGQSLCGVRADSRDSLGCTPVGSIIGVGKDSDEYGVHIAELSADTKDAFTMYIGSGQQVVVHAGTSANGSVQFTRTLGPLVYGSVVSNSVLYGSGKLVAAHTTYSDKNRRVAGAGSLRLVDLHDASVIRERAMSDIVAHADAAIVALHQVALSGNKIALLAVVSSGEVTLIDVVTLKPLWTRSEVLSHAADMQFVDVPADSSLSQDSDELNESPVVSAQSNMVSRYIRRWYSQIGRAIGSIGHVHTLLSFGSDQSAAAQARVGLHKLMVFGTSHGNVAALDSVSRKVVWVRSFGMHSKVANVFVVRQAAVRLPPLVVAVIKSRGTTTVVRFNAFTGENDGEQIELPFPAARAVRLPVEDAAERTHVVGVLAPDNLMHVYPRTASTSAAVARILPKLFTTSGLEQHSNRIRGLAPSAGGSFNTQGSDYIHLLEPSWTIALSEGESIIDVAKRPSHEHVASLGSVLADRSVLYKYLNPHAQAFLTFQPESSGSSSAAGKVGKLTAYVVDVVSGNILHSVVHDSVLLSDVHPARITQAENWAIYTYWNNDDGTDVPEDKQHTAAAAALGAKGNRVAVLEMFESSQKDTKTVPGGSAVSSFTGNVPYVLSNAFVNADAVHAIGVSTTGSGITLRDIVMANSIHRRVFAVPKRVIDARRTPASGRPAAELKELASYKEEETLQYEPFIPDNPRTSLSHGRQVAGVRSIASAPTMLESTSFVAGYGLDVFVSRMQPIGTFDMLGEAFSKANLLLTMIALIVGIVVATPLVKRRALRRSWA